jgi:hypothetical protein
LRKFGGFSDDFFPFSLDVAIRNQGPEIVPQNLFTVTFFLIQSILARLHIN